MIVRMVGRWHARVIVARMRGVLLEMAIDFAIASRTIVAFKCLSRVTKSVLHLHLG